MPWGNPGTASEYVLMFFGILIENGFKVFQTLIENPIFFKLNLGHAWVFHAPGGYPLRALITAAGTRMQFGRILGHVHKHASIVLEYA